MDSTMRRALDRLRGVLGGYAELTERRIILDRPWSHDELHWVSDSDGAHHLHGAVAGRQGSRGPVTRGGWCPCGLAH